MTIPSLMIYPSIWMQKTFFEYAEDEKGARLGLPPTGHRDEFDTSIRVAAVAHAIFQFAYANIMLLPLIIVSVLTAVVTPLSTGFFTQEGGLLERIAISFAAATASLTIPILSSLYTAFNPDELNDTSSFSVTAPIIGHASLLACTLPALPDLVEQLSDRFPAALQPLFGRERSLLFDLASTAARWLAGSDLARESMNQVEQRCYAWRTFLPGAIFELVEKNLSNYDRAFDITSAEFSATVLTALTECANHET